MRNQATRDIASNPGMFLRMLRAEEEGLIELKVDLARKFLPPLYDLISSENMSDIANAWNTARKDVVDLAMGKINKLMTKVVKEFLKALCEDHVAQKCREAYSEVSQDFKVLNYRETHFGNRDSTRHHTGQEI